MKYTAPVAPGVTIESSAADDDGYYPEIRVVGYRRVGTRVEILVSRGGVAIGQVTAHKEVRRSFRHPSYPELGFYSYTQWVYDTSRVAFMSDEDMDDFISAVESILYR